jgi:hypothetical protein
MHIVHRANLRVPWCIPRPGLVCDYYFTLFSRLPQVFDRRFDHLSLYQRVIRVTVITTLIMVQIALVVSAFAGVLSGIVVTLRADFLLEFSLPAWAVPFLIGVSMMAQFMYLWAVLITGTLFTLALLAIIHRAEPKPSPLNLIGERNLADEPTVPVTDVQPLKPQHNDNERAFRQYSRSLGYQVRKSSPFQLFAILNFLKIPAA